MKNPMLMIGLLVFGFWMLRQRNGNGGPYQAQRSDGSGSVNTGASEAAYWAGYPEG